MKKVFPILVVLTTLLSVPAFAQLLDMLNDDDFVSDLPDKPTTAPKPAPKPVAKPAPKPVSKPVAKPAATPAPLPVSVVTAPRPSPKPAAPALPTLSAENSPRPAFPSFGSSDGIKEDMPDLGKNRNKKEEDEDLSLFEKRKMKRQSSESKDVSNFDVAGIRLKMSPEDVVETGKENGFALVRTEKNIPQLKEWNYKRKCMSGGTTRMSLLKECVGQLARTEEKEYTKSLLLENKAEKEKIFVNFTSKNQAFRIRYFNSGDHSLGATEEAYFLKSKRRSDFYRALVKKYGYPDDEEALLWGGSDLGAVLSAEMSETFLDASVVLEDGEMLSKDFDDMATDDVQGMPSAEFHF